MEEFFVEKSKKKTLEKHSKKSRSICEKSRFEDASKTLFSISVSNFKAVGRS